MSEWIGRALDAIEVSVWFCLSISGIVIGLVVIIWSVILEVKDG